jgi:hypothetical protein
MKVWVVGSTVFNYSDRTGRYHLVEDTMRTINLRVFLSAKEAEAHAAEEASEEMRVLYEHNLLSDYCTGWQVERLSDAQRTRLTLILRDSDSPMHPYQICRGPFPDRRLSNAECAELLEIFPHLKWVVREVDV